MSPTVTDRIEKKTFLRAPQSRVWRALTDHEEFGKWFGVRLERAFAPGAVIHGRITHEKYAHVKWEMTIEALEPQRLFSFRWHPYAIDEGVDYASEPTTLVSFELEEAPGGTSLKLVESGFDKIPLERRAKAFEMNDGGWTQQMANIEKHVQGSQ
jgi:uncharacterized protein YndB with AHSA1/START domain